MGTVACKECGKQVAKSAEACPHCGAFRRKRTSPVTWIVTFIIGVPLVIAIASGLFFSTP